MQEDAGLELWFAISQPAGNANQKVLSEMKEFVEDDASQRRRCVEAGSSAQLAEEMSRLRREWLVENEQLFGGGWTFFCDDPVYVRRREELGQKVSFPSLPSPPKQKFYQPVFGSRQTTSPAPRSLHVDEYAKFLLSIGLAEKYRPPNRLPKSPQYPVPEPSFPVFPAHKNNSTPRQLPDSSAKPKVTRWYRSLMQGPQVGESNSWLSELQADRLLYYQVRRAEFEERTAYITGQWQQAKLQWETTVARDMATFQDSCLGYESAKPDGVAKYFQTQLEAIPLLPCCDKEYEEQFEEQEGILLIDLKLPYVKDLEIAKTKQLVGGPKIVPASQKEAREIMNQLPFLVVMRAIWEVPKVDYQHKVKLIACNGYVVYDDPATGNVRRDVILSILAKPEQLEQIQLEKADPEACFRGLKGIAAAMIMELVPVQPLMQFNKHDRRFIAAKEVIDHVGNENLATMDWQDFEHLIRELFEKEFGQPGAEVKITQASRDRGVDAIAFDPDPLRGGKFVIQAKRYTNTVDVSAVRDLYGTVMNEGANRGILVTTSNYGRDAYDFAKDKPITLLNGPNLLHLLEKHGYNMKIDLKEAKRLMSESSGVAFEP
jgi:restriction system protein